MVVLRVFLSSYNSAIVEWPTCKPYCSKVLDINSATRAIYKKNYCMDTYQDYYTLSTIVFLHLYIFKILVVYLTIRIKE